MSATHEPIGCRQAVEHLWAMLDGQLGAVDQEILGRHLTWCLRCCGELAFARELRGMLQDRSTVPVPDDVRHRLEALVDTLTDPTGEVPG